MQEVSPALRKLIITDAIDHARKVGAYQAREWLDTYLAYLRSEDPDGHGYDEPTDLSSGRNVDLS